MEPYRSIFLAPDWQHVAYLGWQDSWPDPDFRVMERQQGPVTRLLAVNAIADAASFEQHWQPLLARLGPCSELCLHDLTGSTAIAEKARAAGFGELGKDQRLLNIATFAIALDHDEAELLASCSSDTRRKIRKAEADGLVFDDAAHEHPAMIARFLDSFAEMARERGLHPLDAGVVKRMVSDRRARLFAVSEREPGAQCAFLLSYETAATGFFLYGASERTKQNDGAGHLLQWGAIRAFRNAGHRWYDMGGLAARDSSDGIFRFKKGFGGELVDLGCEYGRSGALVAAARKGQRLIRRMQGRAA